MEFFDISDRKCDGVSLSLDRVSPEDPERGWAPAYHFFIINEKGEKVGFCDLRIGHSEGLYYGGNIGYTVYDAYRGRHYAEKAVRLLFELAKLHDMGYLYITCQPQNIPSRRTCERLGGEFLGIVDLPEDNDMRVNDGHTCECVFRYELDGGNTEDAASELIKTELAFHGLAGAEYSLIRFKEGVAVARVKAGEGTLILKAFIDGPSRREIKNYRVLRALGVPTLKIFGLSERSILMEDIGASEVLRLGREEDLHDPDVIVSLARWYRLLHERGRAYVSSHGFGMYDEWDMFTLENLEKLSRTLGEECARPLERLKVRYPELRARIDGTPKTLCYNDFYYTNMAVAKDKTEALMFDYNYLGKGCPINDFTNVTYWFTEEEKAVFLSEYGGIDEGLIELQKLISPVISLVSAAERGIFPDWAEEAREELIELEI